MIYIFLKIAKIHYSCIRLCTKFCLNLRELFLRENVSPRKKRKKRTEKEANRNMFLTEKEEKEGCFSQRSEQKDLRRVR